ncbi:hypothetical protein QEZ52_19490 [Aliisedimentitalea scapharcae]|uniref:CVNH domain-containing protein n=1 Tax=Aliisedimentitalea scapharcae TaxID=1524259 RepID=A0ABZ2XV95_9RHOB
MFDLRILSAIPPLTAIALMASPALSAPKVDLDCDQTFDGAELCSPLVACLGQTGIYFTGRAMGWNSGVFAGDTNAGFTCFGQWRLNGFLGLGEATIECDNALTGIVYFTSHDPETGTASGLGRLSNGETIHMWSGHNIRQFLRNESEEVNPRLLCNDVEVPIS